MNSCRSTFFLTTTIFILVLCFHSLQAFTFPNYVAERFQRVAVCTDGHTHPCTSSRIQAILSVAANNKDNNNIPPVNGTGATISQLANDVKLSTLTKNNPTWDHNIAALLEYNETHGTVNLPESSKEYSKLGLWVFNLRRMKGRLAKEQIQQLEDIGFTWEEANMNKYDKKWHDMFMRLKAFKEQYGDCLVPVDYEPDQKPKLGVWVMNQRKFYRDNNIRKDRKDKLESIGFKWRLKEFYERDRPDLEELWEKRFQELIEFNEEHNHTNVPREYPPNQNLSYWVVRQRVFKKDGILREDRQERLDKIGFTWDFEPIWEASWLEQYEELKKYYQELAAYQEMMENSPEGNEDAIRPMLGRNIQMWTAEQGLVHARGALDEQRRAMLDAIGFEW